MYILLSLVISEKQINKKTGWEHRNFSINRTAKLKTSRSIRPTSLVAPGGWPVYLCVSGPVPGFTISTHLPGTRALMVLSYMASVETVGK